MLVKLWAGGVCQACTALQRFAGPELCVRILEEIQLTS